ncbi:protein of unknown function [Acidithiobacillus ferrivorans]|uniref:Uncharacterized protein n=1 Tax=Acidithiobacillus ferrivorans TaxID=160808 RepID=A0A060US98_9PROT|nr:hypothetical protein AFERRI_30070 [Acidithiobacillus ferrivorans]SMH67327.1 protein of unknown function [Acidithiobacillus ferrivorans]
MLCIYSMLIVTPVALGDMCVVVLCNLNYVRGRCAPANGARVSNIGALGAQRPRTPRSSGHRYAASPA